MKKRTPRPAAERQPLPRTSAQHGAQRLPGERPDRFSLATVVGCRYARSAALLADVEPERGAR